MYCYGLVHKLPPEDTVVRQCHFLYPYISMGLGIQDLKFYNLGSILGSIF